MLWEGQLDLKSKFFHRVDELSETITTHLVSGSCADYAEYKMMVGKLAGLQQTRQEFLEIWKQMVQEDDGD